MNYVNCSIILIFYLIFNVFNKILEIPVRFVDNKDKKVLSNSNNNQNDVNLSVNILYTKRKILLDIELGDYQIYKTKQPFSVLLDTGSDVLWVGDIKCTNCYNKLNLYNSINKKKLSERSDIVYGTGRVSGFFYFDKITFSNTDISIRNFVFMSCDYVEDIDLDGILGLSYYSNNKDISLIDQMYDNNIISNKVFSIDYSEYKDSKAKFIFGEYPNEIKKLVNLNKDTVDNNNYLGYCMLYPSLHWSCIASWIGISSVINDDYKYIKINDQVIFDSGTTYNLLTKKTFDILIQYLFKDYIKNKHCNLEKSGSIGNQHIGLICNYYAFSNIKKNIHFIFDKYALYLNPYEYFVLEYTNYYVFKFFMLEGLDVNILGDSTLLKFITSYDKEINRFWFYSDKVYKSQNVKPEDKDIISNEYIDNKYLYIYVIFIVVASIFILICSYSIYKYLKNKRKNNQNSLMYNRFGSENTYNSNIYNINRNEF